MILKVLTIILNFIFVSLAQAQLVDAQNCTNWNGADWDKFIADTLDNQAGSRFRMLSTLSDAKRQCAPNIKSGGYGQCFERIEGYFSQFENREGGMFTSRMSDDAYLASQPQDVMTLPPELNNAENALPQNWREVAKAKGWKYTLFHSGTANEGRLVIYIPGEKYDRMLVYYGFGNPPGNDPTHYDGLQMQAVERKPKNSPELPHYYFKSWGYTGPGHTPVSRASGGRCVSCHISGPRALEPQKNPAFPTEFGGVNNLEEMNKLIVRDGSLDYSPYYDPKNFPSHIDVGSSAGCADCHNGKTRQSLAYSIDKSGRFYSENVHRKVVREKTMPYFDDEHLTDQQRQKLVTYLQDDYAAQLRKWLTEHKCSQPNDPGRAKVTSDGSAPTSAQPQNAAH